MGNFSKYLAPERVAVLNARNKREALDGTLAILADSPCIADYAKLCNAVWQREDALATGLGMGIGAPHVRMSAVRDPVAALVKLNRGVDYGSLDGEPVRLILLVAMPENTEAEWLRYLSLAATLFRDQATRERLFAAPDSTTLWSLVKDA